MSQQILAPAARPMRQAGGAMPAPDQVAPEPVLMTREMMQRRLEALGYPISMSYLNKICAPAIDQGPKPVRYWNRRPLYDLQQAIAWADSKSRKPPARQ